MSKKEQAQKSSEPKQASNVVSIVVDRCKAEGCKSKSARAGFCEEHFVWFKEGLVTAEGHLAKDFEKKFQHFKKSHKKVS